MNVTLQSGIVQAATGTVLGLVGARLAGQAYAIGAGIGAGIGATVELGVILAGKILPREYQYTFQSVCSFTASAVGAHIYGRLANTPIKTAHILLFAGGCTLVTTTIRYFSAPRQQSASLDPGKGTKRPETPITPPQSPPSGPREEGERTKEPIPPSIRYLKPTASNIGLAGVILDPPEQVRFGELLASLFVKGSLPESEITEVHAFLSKGLLSPQDVPDCVDVTQEKIIPYLTDLAQKWDVQRVDPKLWNFANAAYMITMVVTADSPLETLATLYVIQQAIAGNLDESLFDLISKRFRNAKFFDDQLNDEFLSVFKRCMQKEAVDPLEQALYIDYMILAERIFGFLKEMRSIPKDDRAQAVKEMGEPPNLSAAMLDLLPYCESDLSAWEVSILMNRAIGERLLCTLPTVLEQIAEKKLASTYPSKIEDIDRDLDPQERERLRGLLRQAVRSCYPPQVVINEIAALAKKRTLRGQGDGQGLLYSMVCKIIQDGLTTKDPSLVEYREVLKRLAVQFWADDAKINSQLIYLILAYADLYPRLSDEDKELQQDHRIILHAAGCSGQSIQPESQVTLPSGDLKDSVDGLDDFKLTANEKTELSGLLTRLYFENPLQADERERALNLAARGLHKGPGMVGKAMSWLWVGSKQVPEQTAQEAEQLVENYVIQFLNSAEMKFKSGMLSMFMPGSGMLSTLMSGIIKSTPEEMITVMVITLSLFVNERMTKPLDQLAHLYIWRKALKGELEESCLIDLLKRSDIQIFSSEINEAVMSFIMQISRKEPIMVWDGFFEDLCIGVIVAQMRYFCSKGMQQEVEKQLSMLGMSATENMRECMKLIAEKERPIAEVVAKFKEFASIPFQNSNNMDVDSVQKNLEELLKLLNPMPAVEPNVDPVEIDLLPGFDELD